MINYEYLDSLYKDKFKAEQRLDKLWDAIEKMMIL